MTAKARRRSILVVDDELEMLRSLQGLLRLEFDVHIATNVDDAMRILKEESVEIILTDQRMPQMTGVEFLAHAKSHYPEIMRLIFSGYTETAALIGAINQGSVFRYLSKPWDADNLTAVLREAGEQYDRLIEHRQLLNDCRVQGDRFLAFAGEFNSGRDAEWTADRAAQLQQLLSSARAIQDRLEATDTPSSTNA